MFGRLIGKLVEPSLRDSNASDRKENKEWGEALGDDIDISDESPDDPPQTTKPS
jgi:hypothetical protein